MRNRWVWGAGVLCAAVALGACDDDSPTAPRTVDLEAMAGLYDPVELTFDPQGTPPSGDVLAEIQATEPRLVLSAGGAFQIAFLDPVSGLIETPGGVAEPTEDGVRLVFDAQADADLLLFPRTLTLTFDEEEGTLTFSGPVSVPRNRLLAIFSELYADEAFQNPTPGTLIVTFERRETGS